MFSDIIDIMPVYEFKCQLCDRVIEVKRAFGDTEPEWCQCGGTMNKIFSVPGISFKGSGFYSTDNRKK